VGKKGWEPLASSITQESFFMFLKLAVTSIHPVVIFGSGGVQILRNAFCFSIPLCNILIKLLFLKRIGLVL
jgi:hypothetical protein